MCPIQSDHSQTKTKAIQQHITSMQPKHKVKDIFNPDGVSEPPQPLTWKNLIEYLLGELLIQFILFILLPFLLLNTIAAYTFFGLGALLLIFPYAALLYYLYQKLIKLKPKQPDQSTEKIL